MSIGQHLMGLYLKITLIYSGFALRNTLYSMKKTLKFLMFVFFLEKPNF